MSIWHILIIVSICAAIYIQLILPVQILTKKKNYSIVRAIIFVIIALAALALINVIAFSSSESAMFIFGIISVIIVPAIAYKVKPRPEVIRVIEVVKQQGEQGQSS